jgi:hypothetical protein
VYGVGSCGGAIHWAGVRCRRPGVFPGACGPAPGWLLGTVVGTPYKGDMTAESHGEARSALYQGGTAQTHENTIVAEGGTDGGEERLVRDS